MSRERDLRRIAREMAARQKSISVSEFFLKNRHLLGFDSPRKALLIAVKEAVDNALDACEEARLLPDIVVEVTQTADDTFSVAVSDLGPGILEQEIANVFGKLLYGSKFHKLSQTRGQQGIGISAVGMYGQLTTGKPMRIVSRIAGQHLASEIVLGIDTLHNRPEIQRRAQIAWKAPHGTRVELELEGHFRSGAHSIETYLRQTAIANPHADIRFRAPDASEIHFARSSRVAPPAPVTILPHPHGIELGTLVALLKSTKARNLSRFLRESFSRIGAKTAQEVIRRADHGLTSRSYPRRVAKKQAVALHRALAATSVSAPRTDCLAPIGETRLISGLKKEVSADFYAAVTRPPAVYRGNPFVVEAGLAFGHKGRLEVSPEGRIERAHAERGAADLFPGPDEPAKLLRFANRVPLLFEPGSCVTTKAVLHTNFHAYGLPQPKGSLPLGPLLILLHVASVWVPFTSESKEAIAAYPEIEHELELALRQLGRKLGTHLARQRRLETELARRREIQQILPQIGEALSEILGLGEPERRDTERRLVALLSAKRAT